MADYEGAYEPEYNDFEGEVIEYEDQPAEQEYEEEYPEQGYAEDGSGDGQGEEVNINIPAEEDYPSFDEIGLTDDAIRIVQEFVLGNGHLKLTSDQLAENMRDVDGNEHPDAIQFARMVLDVWRLRNPHLEAFEEDYPMEESPEHLEEEGQYMEEVAQDDAAVLSASYTEEAEGEVIEVVSEVTHDAPLERRRSSIRIVSESGYTVNVPHHEDYLVYNESVDFAHRLVENHVVRSGDLRLPEAELAASLLDPSGHPIPGALEIAIAVLNVWADHNPHLEALPRTKPSPFPPLPPGVHAPHDGKDMLFTVPPDEDFPAPDRFGILSTVTALVFQSVMETSSLAITAEQVAERMVPHSGGDQYEETRDIALAVLDAWRHRNPHLPTVAPSRTLPPPSEAPYEIIEREPTAGTSVTLPDGRTLVIPPESDYPAFDRSGLTDDAIRIVREFVMETGSLGITAEQAAGQMVDFLGGGGNPDAVPIAASVLAVWRARNPSLPLTSAKELYPAVALAGPVAPTFTASPAPAALATAPSGSASSAITAATSKNSVIPEGAGVLVTAPPEPITFGIPGDQKIHVEREDSRDVLMEAELAVLLERLGCEVAPCLSPLFGPGVRLEMVSSRSILYKSGAEPGDAIIEMDGMTLTKTSQLYSLLSRLAPGSRFSWRLRRHSPAGTITEYTVIQSFPLPKMKAVEPRWAGLPKARPYRSHSNLLPNDPGFAEAYSQIPVVVGPPAGAPQRLWNTRVVDGGMLPAHALEHARASTVADTAMHPFDGPYPSASVVGPAFPTFPRTVAAAPCDPCAAAYAPPPPVCNPCATYAPPPPVCNPCATYAPPVCNPCVTYRPSACDPCARQPTGMNYAPSGRITVPRTLAPRREVIQLAAADVAQVQANMVNKYMAKIDRQVPMQTPVQAPVPLVREVRAAPVSRPDCGPCAVSSSASRYAAAGGYQ